MRSVVLIGLMGAGKSTVGARVAGLLGWRFVDLDEAVERRLGRPIAQIFKHSGEDVFRAAEREAASEILAASRVVLATGGGWAAQPGTLESLETGSVSVWLRVSPEEAVRRALASGAQRPLLAESNEDASVADPLATARRLAEERAGRYALATFKVDVETLDAQSAAELIVGRIEQGVVV